MFNYNQVMEELEAEWAKNCNIYRLGLITKGRFQSPEVRALVGLLVNKGILAPDDEAKPELKVDKEPTFVVIYEETLFAQYNAYGFKCGRTGNPVERENVWTLSELEKNYEERNITKTIFIRERP